MANPQNLEGKGFVKGKSGNPKGRPRKLVSSLIEKLGEAGAQRVTAQQVVSCYETLIGLSINELTAIATDKDNPAIMAIAAKQLLSKDGFAAAQTLLEIAHGKPTQRTVLEGNEEKPLSITIVMPDTVTALPTDS